ncbi:hypothetical protein [Methylobacterium nodulans]|uniref:Uncharacterized protein n=1 Tax=Methylobacterium nodulans (strain LMG 21967 / CNCM I-2342 / ORS 2060) TaxID=460265 RepID=B8ICS7_METNO|nr:hypothetical protein [Methylobacterium nodulans]ACL57488.1 conserved hypothetical protein [Methylobacterium nodulans ORS 2060]
MPRRPAAVTQADIARAIRAVRDAGLPVTRVVLRPDGIAVETTEGAITTEPFALPPEEPEAERRDVIL